MRPTPSLLAILLVAAGLLAAPAAAKEEDEELLDVFGGLGTASSLESEEDQDEEPPAERRAGEGTIRGRVFDGETGDPVAGATVIVEWAEAGQDGEPRQEVQISRPDGTFEFPSIPPGRYTLTFIKSGYRLSNMTDFGVEPDTVNRADFPLPPIATVASDEILELDAFVVEASAVGEMLTSLELRVESDQLLNILSAEDLSKYAASDVADALKRVAGVNVVEGQFAIIRGLEDRYSSTLYNGSPVPSPDPNRQSVQLDLFPSDIVGDLVVSKTFGAEHPSNSSGGSVDIVTHQYTEEPFEIKLSAGSGWEQYALDRFLRLNTDSPTGVEIDGSDVIETDFSASMGGHIELLGRELSFKGITSREVDFKTLVGFQETQEPRRRNLGTQEEQVPSNFPEQSGGLALGELALSDGRFEGTRSDREEQRTAYLGFGFDLDREARHRIDASVFYTRKEEEEVELKENGFFPGFDYGEIVALEGGDTDRLRFDDITPQAFVDAATIESWIANGVRTSRFDVPQGRGHLWFGSFMESRAVARTRDLRVFQLNGRHEIPGIEGLRVAWSANQATTGQSEEASRARIFYEPEDRFQTPTRFPVAPEDLGPGRFAINPDLTISGVDVEETQDFARIDVSYERPLLEFLELEVGAGAWWERSKRGVDARFLDFPIVSKSSCSRTPICTASGATSFVVNGDTLREAGENVFPALIAGEESRFAGDKLSTNDGAREIQAYHLDLKLTLFDDVDLLAGLRREEIEITTEADALVGLLDGRAETFPTRYLLFDRLDNPDSPIEGGAPTGSIFNDQLLNITVPADPVTGIVDIGSEELPSLLNAAIDETRTLPSFGITYRPIEGMTLRTAYSKTVARPSFRELGFYVTVPPGKKDLEVGNPQLQLSDVESVDARLEYTWGPFGDLFAVSAFFKTIDLPIEKIVIRDPLNFDDTSRAIFRTWFNNPNEATLWGIEVEGRKNLGFLNLGSLGWDWLEYLSVGANFTYIDAEVGRTDAELQRSEGFFGTLPEDADRERFSRLAPKRRLFGQPEWIGNADLSFDHPEWGTRFTLAFFAISDVLDAAGSANPQANFQITSFTLDEYIDAFHQLDLIFRQKLWRGIELKVSLKNLTDSQRGVIYDPEQTRGEIAERRTRVGRDYSFSLSFEHQF